MATDNYQKHKSKNPLKKLFIKNFFNTIYKELKPLKIESVLDVGCGEGFTLKRLKTKKIGKIFKGVDLEKEAIKLGRRENPKLDLSIGDIYNLKFKDNSFDLVISTEVLEHLEKPDIALKELARVSKKYILLSVPNEPLFLLSNYTQWGKDIGHINKWTAKKFKEFVKAQGLNILVIKTPFPWTMVLAKKLTVDKRLKTRII